MLEDCEDQLKGVTDHFIVKYTVLHDEWSKRRNRAVNTLTRKVSSTKSGSFSRKFVDGIRDIIDFSGKQRDKSPTYSNPEEKPKNLEEAPRKLEENAEADERLLE